MITLYIGCSLTHAPDDYKKDIEKLKSYLKKDHEILEFIGLTKGTPQDVYEWDTKCVKTCDLFVGECSMPSIGLGAELGIALEIGKPTIVLVREDAKVTRYVLGVTKPNYWLYKYKTIEEAEKFVRGKIQELFEKKL
jgi:hypothetical protein